ncbi:GerMN domain-containing protein [Clostridium sp. 1001275B_160808_H3]|uniref:GerMN domain-containing protein n=1 Tax=Clostridium sp. 1001275B_160808_H3 TaxID=2787110 RepID=UPI00189BB103|nr:GerMN domain-containing protein [Clostridium sp. 1001275B_160808_H3]
MKKRLFLLIFSLVFSLILIGCNKSKDEPVSTPSKNIVDEEKNPNDDKDTDNPSDDKPSNNNSNENKSITNTKVRLFYFDSSKLKLYYIDKEIQISDKAIVKALTKELQNYSPNNNFLNLTNEVEITSAKLDENKKLLTVVFSSSYVDKMTLGSSTESGLLSSLISTYAYNLNVDKVAIYFGDKLYTSLKGDLPNGYFNVDYSSAIPYSKNSYNNSNTGNNSETNAVKKTINSRIYYYNCVDDVFYYKDKPIEVIDGALVTALSNELKNPPDKNLFNFGDSLSIRSAKLDRENNTLTVDLSKSYYNLLSNLGSGSEAAALKSLALTYGYNYGVDKVIILVNGKPYSGSHIILEVNECINIDVDNIKPLNI